jgi:hypothetical protein
MPLNNHSLLLDGPSDVLLPCSHSLENIYLNPTLLKSCANPKAQQHLYDLTTPTVRLKIDTAL